MSLLEPIHLHIHIHIHMEEADTDSEMESQREPPEIEISDVDEHDLLEQRDKGDDLMNPDSPVFIVGGENGCIQFWRPFRTAGRYPSNK